MIEQKTIKLSAQVSRVSVFLTRDFSSSVSLERNLEKKSLDLKRKLVEDRGRILTSIASRGRGKQTGGGIGAALGLLGIGGGGLLRRGLKRTPNSPNQLLRMQKGTSNLSRASKLGKLARPLAVVGTGLDFIGRKAEGQTNVQAGVGAAGGLAGAIGGAKIGATIGTAILPGAGTAIGGVGGSIIGSLSGGRIADLFTGANRRRQFEEERVVLRNQKTQFSEALDDFDNALDKFEDVVGGLAIRRGGDDGVIRRRKRPSGLPKPPSIGERIKDFADKPAVQAVGVTALVTGLIALAVFTRGKSATKSQPIIQELLKKTPALKNFTKKEQIVGLGRVLERTFSKSQMQKIRMSTAPAVTKRGTVIPGQKGAPGISKKGLEARNLSKAERIELAKVRKKLKDDRLKKRLKKLEEGTISDAELKKLENDPKASEIINEITRTTGKGVTLDPSQMTREMLTKVEKATKFLKKTDPTSKVIGREMLDLERSNIVNTIKKLSEQLKESPKESTKIRLNDAKKALKIIDDTLKKFAPKQIKKRLNIEKKIENTDLSSNFKGTGSTDIALADITPRGNIFVQLNQKEGDTINVVKNESNLRMKNRNVDPTATTYKYFELVQGLTA